MINIRSILKLTENDGMTLKNGNKITYKSGWQVATEGVECKTAREAMNAVKAYNGNCGVWYSEGIYYVDKSKRVSTKREAMEIGRACNQISILKWANMSLAYCEYLIKKIPKILGIFFMQYARNVKKNNKLLRQAAHYRIGLSFVKKLTMSNF